MTPIEFLHARLDVDEQIARKCFDTREDWVAQPRAFGGMELTGMSGARVLREIEAKRAILRLHESWPTLIQTEPTFEVDHGSTDPFSAVYRVSQKMAFLTNKEYRDRFGEEAPTGPIIRELLKVYRDHEDFQEEWLV